MSSRTGAPPFALPPRGSRSRRRARVHENGRVPVLAPGGTRHHNARHRAGTPSRECGAHRIQCARGWPRRKRDCPQHVGRQDKTRPQIRVRSSGLKPGQPRRGSAQSPEHIGGPQQPSGSRNRIGQRTQGNEDRPHPATRSRQSPTPPAITRFPTPMTHMSSFWSTPANCRIAEVAPAQPPAEAVAHVFRRSALLQAQWVKECLLRARPHDKCTYPVISYGPAGSLRDRSITLRLVA